MAKMPQSGWGSLVYMILFLLSTQLHKCSILQEDAWQMLLGEESVSTQEQKITQMMHFMCLNIQVE